MTDTAFSTTIERMAQGVAPRVPADTEFARGVSYGMRLAVGPAMEAWANGGSIEFACILLFREWGLRYESTPRAAGG